jgi:hypothetical protein
MSTLYVNNIAEATTGSNVTMGDGYLLYPGAIVHSGHFFPGTDAGAGLASSTSTSWVTIPLNGATGQRGLNVTQSSNVLTFNKKHDNSFIEMEWSSPYYFVGTGHNSGFGVRARVYKSGAGTASYLDPVTTDGYAHGWAAGGYGQDTQTGLQNWKWSTYHRQTLHDDLVDYKGDVLFYLEARNWSSSNTLHLGYYSTSYDWTMMFYFREIAL